MGSAPIVQQGRPCECALTCDPDPVTKKCPTVVAPDRRPNATTFVPMLSFAVRERD